MKIVNTPSGGGFRHFTEARFYLGEWMKQHGHQTHPDTWQGVEVKSRPDMKSTELLNVTFTVPLDSEDLDHWREDIQPNLPWADNHFAERVCGYPINPGVEWKNWPWANSADKFLENGMFNHNYMERIWPKYAGVMEKPTRTPEDCKTLSGVDFPMGRAVPCPNHGIRGEYGDLNDLVKLLVDDPLTRQAYLPLYFPEDTGSPGRKPCTLGYQFIRRRNDFFIYYPLRSCDLVRHWADDCYLAVRLLLWVLDQCRSLSDDWKSVRPRGYTMHMTSLHVFANDMRKL